MTSDHAPGMDEEAPIAGDYKRNPAISYTVSEWERKPDLFGEQDDSEDSDDDDDGKNKSALIRTSSALRKVSNAAQKFSEKIAMKLCRKPSRSNIEASSPVEIDPEGLYCVSIDGYYRKSKGFGGYGAILRCEDGRPIAAVAGASLRPVSGFYHTLEGMRAGFALAIENNVNYVHMVCNSDSANWTLQECFASNYEGDCDAHPKGEPYCEFDMFCITCAKMSMGNDDFDCTFEIMKKVVQLGKRYFCDSFLTFVERDWNEPADFLAKLVRSPGKERILRPHEFPDRLNFLLSEFDGGLPFDLA